MDPPNPNQLPAAPLYIPEDFFRMLDAPANPVPPEHPNNQANPNAQQVANADQLLLELQAQQAHITALQAQIEVFRAQHAQQAQNAQALQARQAEERARHLRMQEEIQRFLRNGFGIPPVIPGAHGAFHHGNPPPRIPPHLWPDVPVHNLPPARHVPRPDQVPRPRNDPQLLPAAAQTQEETEEVYTVIHGMFKDVKRNWIIERAGHGTERIADFIINHEDFVPRDERPAEDDDEEEMDTSGGPLDYEQEEKRNITIDSLKQYIITLDEAEWPKKATSGELKEYVKHQYKYVKTQCLSKIKSGDPRKVLAICKLIEDKAMTPDVAVEIGIPSLYDSGDPRCVRPRHIHYDIKHPHYFKKAQKEINTMIEASVNEVKKYSCPACFENFSIHGIMSCTGLAPDDQSHFLCLGCMKGHAEYITGNEPLADSQGIRCHERPCENILLASRIEQLLNKKEKKFLANRLAQAALGDIDGIEKCPKCDYAAFIDQTFEENKVFSCDKCSFECCRRCQRNWNKHCGLSCAEMEANESEAEKRRKLEEKLSEAVTLKCPKCKTKWAKKSNSGECNKMTCTCGCKFCMICLKGDIDYSHFCRHCNDGNCPQDCGKPCHLYEPDDAVEKKKREAAMREANGEAGPGPGTEAAAAAARAPALPFIPHVLPPLPLQMPPQLPLQIPPQLPPQIPAQAQPGPLP